MSTTLTGNSTLDKAVNYVASLEGFRSTPYWDHKQWSCGYGTGVGYDKSSKPSITWTVDQAKQALRNRLTADMALISQALRKPVSENQTVALLSFNYNEGFGNTQKIINRINTGADNNTVASAMKLYIYASGVVNSDLVDRRNKETSLYLS